MVTYVTGHRLASDWHQLCQSTRMPIDVSALNGTWSLDWPEIGNGLARIKHGLARTGSSANSMAIHDRRVCLKFILREDQGPSRIEHLFLGYLDKWSSEMTWKWHCIGQDWHWICWDWHRLDNWQTFVFVKNWPPIGTWGTKRLGTDWFKIGFWVGPGLVQDWHRIG